MVRAMFPVPTMVMLLMRCLSSCSRGVSSLWRPGCCGCIRDIPVCGSDGGGAAVGDQFQAVDVARLVGGEEQGDCGDFFGTAHLSAGDEGLERGPGRLVEQCFLVGGADLAGGQDVDPVLAVPQFVEPDAGPGLLYGLASRVE